MALARSAARAAIFSLLGLAVALHTPKPAKAETHEIRISQQFGLTWLALYVMLDQKMIETRAKELGLGDMKVTLMKFSGGPAANEALLSGTVDIAGSGGPPAMILQDRTFGRQNVRAIASVVDAPVSLVTVDPRIKSLADYGPSDRIALPAPKVSINAMIIQMAAAKLYGMKGMGKFDELEVGMPHPDATIALISGNQTIKSYMGIFPYVDEVLAKARGAHVVLNSYEVVGGPHNLAVLSCTQKWKTENPKAFQAVVQALQDAMAFINADKKRAAEIYVRADKASVSADTVAAYISGPDIIFETTPRKTMAFAEFMYMTGQLRHRPKSWKDFFWENVYNSGGN